MDKRTLRDKIESLRSYYGSYRKVAKSLGISDRQVRRIAHGEIAGKQYAERINRRVRYYERERELKPPVPSRALNRIDKLVKEYGSQKELAKSLGVSEKTISRARKTGKIDSDLAQRINRRYRHYSWEKELGKLPEFTEPEPEKDKIQWQASWRTADPMKRYVGYVRLHVLQAYNKRGESVAARRAGKLRKDIDIVGVYRTEILGIFTKEEFAREWRQSVREVIEHVRKLPNVVAVDPDYDVFRNRKPIEE